MSRLRSRFERGETVVWRSRPQGAVGYTIPFVCLQDGPELIVLAQQNGSICMKRTGKRGGPRGRSLAPGGSDGGHSSVRWAAGYDVVKAHVPGTAHAVMRRWLPVERRFEGWYVNLERSWTRTTVGFDSRDLVLDVVADDLDAPRLKDEDELAWAEESGKLTTDEVQLARCEADRVLELIALRRGLFAADWTLWRPDPSWPLAELPTDWKGA